MYRHVLCSAQSPGIRQGMHLSSHSVKLRKACMRCAVAGRLLEILGIKELPTPHPRTARGGGSHSQQRLIRNDSSWVVLGVNCPKIPSNILWQIGWSVTQQSQGCPGTGFHGCSGSREAAAPETASSYHLSCCQRP